MKSERKNSRECSPPSSTRWIRTKTRSSSYESIVQNWIEDLAGIAGVRTERGFPSEAGQPHARAIVRLDAGFSKTRDQVIDELKTGDVWIEVSALVDEPNAIALNPQTLTSEEAEVVAARLRQVLTSD